MRDYNVQPHSKSKSSDGRVEKKTSKRPVSVKEKEALKQARKAMRTGETMSEDQRRRAEQDRRTLYIRFKVSFFSSCKAVNMMSTHLGFTA